jgi:hypothetical protein
MKKGFLVGGSFLLLFLSAGGMLALLGAQERETGHIPAPGRTFDEQIPSAPLNPGRVDQRNFCLEQVLETPSGLLYALSKERGFLVSFNNGDSWLERNQGLPRRVVYPFEQNAAVVRHLTSLNIDPLDEGRVAVTTASELYLSENYGSSWQRIPIDKPLRSTSYLTSVALSANDRDTLLVGTSFNGFFETRDRGASWRDPSLSAGFLYRGAGFYEEVSGLSYHPGQPGKVFFACGFGQGIYEGSGDGKSWTRLDFPGDERGEVVQRLEFVYTGGAWRLQAQTQRSRWHYDPESRDWRLAGKPTALEKPAVAARHVSNQEENPFRRERLRKASGRFGIYLSSFHARGEELDRHLRFIRENGLNALVVDCKDDFGWIAYDTQLELPNKIGAVDRRFRLEELLAKAHAQDVYVVARLVVFKDQRLFNYNDHEYAVWNGATEQPWRYLVKVEVPPAEPAGKPGEESGKEAPGGGHGEAAAPGRIGQPGEPTDNEPVQPTYKLVQKEYWVDPYSTFVWNYNRAIAEELQKRGVDEIQFDYIRFPSDGNLAQIRYRYRPEGMSPIDALESFLISVRESVHIPISTDLYGFNAWHRMGNWIGQSIEMVADYVDVICPMFYPSHFPRDFMKEVPYLERARRIYYEGTSRAAYLVGKRSLIRPYVQAFLIGGELAMDVGTYSLYLTSQIEGSLAAPSSGFTLWNASNRYYMVTRPLTPLLSGQ